MSSCPGCLAWNTKAAYGRGSGVQSALRGQMPRAAACITRCQSSGVAPAMVAWAATEWVESASPLKSSAAGWLEHSSGRQGIWMFPLSWIGIPAPALFWDCSFSCTAAGKTNAYCSLERSDRGGERAQMWGLWIFIWHRCFPASLAALAWKVGIFIKHPSFQLFLSVRFDNVVCQMAA